MQKEELFRFLEDKYKEYNVPGFIPNDPISIPHRFTKSQDIEIAGFFSAILAWGQRITVINSCNRLFEAMDQDPHNFILNHSDEDLKGLEGFVHRTFQTTDLLYFIHFLKFHYQQNESLESAFCKESSEGMYSRLAAFRDYFFSLDSVPNRTKKHIATPVNNSTCKRINMYLRWMVRTDDSGVDFGIWNQIPMSELMCPFDVHVGRVARHLGLVERKQNDWKASSELTDNLRHFDPHDPSKYDYSLFGLGIENKNKEFIF